MASLSHARSAHCFSLYSLWTDIELIEDNPQEFVRRCLEGAEGNTRRGAAVELVHALMQCFDAQVMKRFLNRARLLLKSSASS